MAGAWTAYASSVVLGIIFCGSLFGFTIAEDAAPELRTVIGIDLGTTYSCVGVYRNGHVEIIPNDQGNRITPSWVAFTDTETLIGEAAKNQAAVNPERTIFNVKRLMGRKFEDKEVQKIIKHFPYKIVNKDEKPYIQVKIKDGETKVFSPEEISAMILVKMKETAEAFLGKKITDAVIAVPAYFNDAQRQATKDAGVIAGLNDARIIIETSAAAIAYGLDKKDCEKNILVFDLGGGTFDVSVLTIDNGVFEVLSTNGDTHLGGEDFDQRILEYFIEDVKTEHLKDISSKDYKALGRLRREAESVKINLSSQHYAYVEIESLFDDVKFSAALHRKLFGLLNKDLFKKIMGPVKQAIKDAGLEKNQIDEIVLVGGSTKIPKVQQLLKDYFNDKELNEGVNPDEVVAYGAAVQGAILSGEGGEETKDIRLLDVVQLSIGVLTNGGIMTKIIHRNTVIPTKISDVIEYYQGYYPRFERFERFETATIKVFEGERIEAKDCKLLGEINLTNIRIDLSQIHVFELTYEVDVLGILTVTAEEKASGSSAKITIMSDKGRLRREEIKMMVREASEYAEEDDKVERIGKMRKILVVLAYNMKIANLAYHDPKIESAVDEAFQWVDRNPYAMLHEFLQKCYELERVNKASLFDRIRAGDMEGGHDEV